MLKLQGTVVTVNTGAIPSTGTNFTRVQIMVNGQKYAKLESVTDYENREYKPGQKIEMPVYVKVYKTKNGAVGYNFIAERS